MVGEVKHAEPEPPGRPYVISVYGADRPGIVHRVTSALAAHKMNITDLVSHLVTGTYAMVLDVDLPQDLDEVRIASELETLANELQIDIAFRPSEAVEL